MSNDFFNASGTPAQSSSIVSPNVRAEFAAIGAGFDKLPALTGNAYEVTYINASGTAMASVGGDGLLKMSTTGIPTVAAVGTDYTNLAVLSAATAATPNDADLMPVVDATVTKKLSLANLKAFLKTYFDTIYAALAGSVSQAFAAASIELGHASDTTLTRVSAGVMAVEGATVAMISADQSWTGSPRATPVTDNDGSFDMNAGLDFLCTPSAGFTLTFTNITQGQRGSIYLVNGSNYAIAAAATSKVTSSLLATVSATGEYWLSYWSPDGTNVLVVAAGDFA